MGRRSSANPPVLEVGEAAGGSDPHSDGNAIGITFPASTRRLCDFAASSLACRSRQPRPKGSASGTKLARQVKARFWTPRKNGPRY